ncbi:MAG TPA: hypothetical protein VHJ34_14345 [Actinomycetota bacterium]|nr:hypothetical protein [Actinomycetota bacterium]
MVRMLLDLVIFAAGFVGLDLVARRYGVDTRDGNDWSNHRSL